MPKVRYYWDIEALPVPNLSNHSAQYVCQKLRNKFGNGEIHVVGDKVRLSDNGSTAFGMDAIPFVNFIHVASGQQNTGNKILLEKIMETDWRKDDVIVLLTADIGLTSELMKLKTKGVVVNLVGNRLNQLAWKLREAAGRSQIYRWTDIVILKELVKKNEPRNNF